MSVMSEERDLLAEFHLRPVLNADKTEQQKAQVYEDILYVRIHIKGSKNAIQDKIATAEDKLRFPRAWAMYEAKGETGCGGTPLDKLPCMSQSLEMNLKALGVHNVEDLSQLNLNGALNLKGGQGLKTQAKEYLKLAGKPVKASFEVDEDPVDVEALTDDPDVDLIELEGSAA